MPFWHFSARNEFNAALHSMQPTPRGYDAPTADVYFECRMPNAECRMPNAECRTPNAERRTTND
jgi:hypothetical protein